MHIRTEHAFGFRFNPGSVKDYVDLAESSINNHTKIQVFYQNLHSLYLSQRDPSIRKLHENAYIMVDGMPLIGLLKMAGIAVERRHRVTWVDFVWPLLKQGQDRQWRVFYLGSLPEVQADALSTIRDRLPGLIIEGHHGHFDPRANSAESVNIIDRINAFGADLCLIGMGTPRQEQWVFDHWPAISATAVFGCGACMEYVAGAVRTPPRWMGRWGLEWSFRLMENPRRFGHRYLIEPWYVVANLIFQHIRSVAK